MSGRTIAIGDIHGCDRPLSALLGALDIQRDDTVVLLGDLCDRGPNTKRAIDLLLDLSERCTLKLILGNHDEMMLGVCGVNFYCDRGAWDSVGGYETVESYGHDLIDIPQRHLDFLDSGLPYFETEKDVFVHACLEYDWPLVEQDGETLRWRKIRGDEPPFYTGQRIVCGHTSQRSGLPLVWPGWVCIDTRVFDTGWLTALDCDANQIIQAHASGQVNGPTPLPEPTI